MISDNLITDWFKQDLADQYAIEQHFPREVAQIRRAASLQQADGILCGLIDKLAAGPVEGITETQRAFMLERLRGCRIQAWTSTDPGGLIRGPEFTR